MDMRMPELDGYETTKRLKANAILKGIPVIAVTASSFREEEARARKACDGFIRKPFNRSELIAELKRFLKPVATSPVAPDRIPAVASVAASESVSAAAMGRRAELSLKLREAEENLWPKLMQSMSMARIEEFAGRLKAWADEGEWPALRRYAAVLEQQVQEFDLDKLPKTLQEFPEVRRQLDSA
jgi:response regulator RpfG family c-di-GMP phosphodiesterase